MKQACYISNTNANQGKCHLDLLRTKAYVGIGNDSSSDYQQLLRTKRMVIDHL